MTADLNTFIQSYQAEINQHLSALTASSSIATRLADATSYAATAPGKRLRPVLVYATSLLGNAHPATNDVAAAIEMIHCYSLVHDDLPSMDDDDLRRGHPTTHIAFDEPTAILVGDGLQCLAFETIAKCPASAEMRIEIIQVLSGAAGNQGMVGGQQLDIDSTGVSIDQDQLERIHRLKTGALIEASVQLGAILAELTETQRANLSRYAQNLGLAFQVVDDILDIESSTEQLGKQQGADQALDKSTYPKLMGIEQSKLYAHTLVQDAIDVLDGFGDEANHLRQIAHYVVTRTF